MKRSNLPAALLTVAISATLVSAQGESCELRREGPSRFDLDADGVIDITDPVTFLNWLFLGAPRPERQHDRPCIVERVDALESRVRHGE